VSFHRLVQDLLEPLPPFAFLNSLLTVANERLFHNDGKPIQVPLVSMFGASSELPEGKELEALFDRFLLRFDVGYLLRPANLRLVLTSPDASPSVQLDMKSLRTAQQAVAAVKITDETVDALLSIRDACRAAANCEDRSDRSFRARPPSLLRAHSDQGRIRTGFGLPHAELAELEAALTWALARTVP
jgi:MoxR-like ATPase